MRAVVQRVKNAKVSNNETASFVIEYGSLAYVAFSSSDNPKSIEYICNKIIHLRIFEDTNGKMNLSLADKGLSLLLIPQFTLYGDVRRGRRPSFDSAAEPEIAEKYFASCVDIISKENIHVVQGFFRTHMDVDYINDGPITILLDSDKQF